MPVELAVGDNIALLNGVTFAPEEGVFDDFVGGVSFDRWAIGNGAWGSGNGGVVPKNVSYSEDGVLILRGNGLYYAGDDVKGVGALKDGRNTGAALISKFKTAPGRYETKMKVLPRLGACTALWTFANRPTASGVNDNHEIDIELPGGKTSGIVSFKNVLNTNYITEQYFSSQDVNLKEAFSAPEETFLNDGRWHTFGFDWYTNPGRVLYFVDGRVTAQSDVFVPTLQTHIWLGNWFPNNSGFVGQSLFETDYMYVDWFKYLPFDSSQSFEACDPGITVETAPASLYPTSPAAYPEINKASDGDFEYILDHAQNDYAWKYGRLSTETQNVIDVCGAEAGLGHDDSCGAFIKDGGYLSQNIDSTYEGFGYDLSFQGKSLGAGSKVVVNFVNAYTSRAIESYTFPLDDASAWKKYGGAFIAPKESYAIRLEAYTQTGTTMYLDDVVVEKL